MNRTNNTRKGGTSDEPREHVFSKLVGTGRSSFVQVQLEESTYTKESPHILLQRFMPLR